MFNLQEVYFPLPNFKGGRERSRECEGVKLQLRLTYKTQLKCHPPPQTLDPVPFLRIR